MEYLDAKEIVIKFFENHVEKFAFEDLNNMIALMPTGAEGLGSTAIPQCSATFALCDLFGSLFDPQAVGENNPMRIKGFLKQKWFKEFHDSYTGNLDDLLDFIRDSIRSKTSHRFFLPKVSISKDSGLPHNLFIGYRGSLIFNVNHFTKRVIDVLKQIKVDIERDSFHLDDENDTQKIVIRMAEKLEQLKESSSKYDAIIELLIQQNQISSTIQIPFQTTSSLG
jgi:hypothetical protein